MKTIPQRELRNQISAVLRRVESGESVRITVNGRPVADLVPIGRAHRKFVAREEISQLLRRDPLDPAFRRTTRRPPAPPLTTCDSTGTISQRSRVARHVCLYRQRSGRPLGPLPLTGAISVITLAEFHLGVLMADDPVVGVQRLRTLSSVEGLLEPVADRCHGRQGLRRARFRGAPSR